VEIQLNDAASLTEAAVSLSRHVGQNFSLRVLAATFYPYWVFDRYQNWRPTVFRDWPYSGEVLNGW
jgi:hypothetical protein